MESAITYYKLLGILNFDNIVKFKIATFAKKLSSDSSKFPYIFHDYLIPISDIHSYNTRLYASDNFYRPKVRTNYGQSTIKFIISKLWNCIPPYLKHLNIEAFKIQYCPSYPA